MTDSHIVTLSDRYVLAVTRRLPERNRTDVAGELRALIADDVDARTASGVTTEQAERDAIESLGDPARLAASYANRPLHLIGPRLYVQWVNLLRLLLLIVLPFVAGGVILAKLIDDAPVGEIAVQTLGVLIGTVVHLCFWVTVVFAVLDRVDGGASAFEEWTADDLVEEFDDRWKQRWALITSSSWLAIGIVALISQHLLEPIVTPAGERAPVFDPQLWSWWLPYAIVVAVVDVVLGVLAYRRRRWTMVDASLAIVLAIALAVPFIVLVAREQLFTPGLIELVATATDASIPRIVGSVLIAVAIGAVLWRSIDVVLLAARDRRSEG